MIFGFADIGRGLLALRLVAERAVIFTGQRVFLRKHHRLERADRRGDRYQHLVAADLQRGLRIHAPAPVRVVGGEQRRAVDADRRERVEPVEHQVEVIALEHRRGNVEHATELPFGQPGPLDRRLVGALERIRHAVRGDQVLLHRAGDGRRKPLGLALVCGGRGGVGWIDPHLPRAVELHDGLGRCERRCGERDQGKDEPATHQRVSDRVMRSTA
jgi:hypothetical protein